MRCYLGLKNLEASYTSWLEAQREKKGNVAHGMRCYDEKVHPIQVPEVCAPSLFSRRRIITFL